MGPAHRAAGAGCANGNGRLCADRLRAFAVRPPCARYLYVTETIWPSIAVLRVFAL